MLGEKDGNVTWTNSPLDFRRLGSFDQQMRGQRTDVVCDLA
jgi:hypothetical protein